MQFLRLFILSIFILTGINVKAQYIVSEKYMDGNSLDSNEILDMYMDSRQFLWVTTKYGIYIKDMGKFKLLKRFKEIKFNNVYDIFEDKNNNIWFASYGHGVARFDGSKVVHLTEKNGLVSDLVSKIITHDGKIYAAGVNGISIINMDDFSIKKIEQKSTTKRNFHVITFFELGKKLYACTKYHGVFEVTDNELKFVYDSGEILNSYSYRNNVIFSSIKGIKILSNTEFLNNVPKENSVELPIIWDYEKVANNKIWMVTHDIVSSAGGILEFDGTSMKSITSELNLADIVPNRIVYDKFNNVAYISTLNQGLMRFVFNTPYKYYPTDHSSVESIKEFQSKEYLITSNGLYVNDGDKPRIITSKNEFWKSYQNNKEKFKKILSSKPKFFRVNENLREFDMKFYRLEVENGNLWVNSNIGLFKINTFGKILSYYPIYTQYFSFNNNQLIEAQPSGGMKIYRNLDQIDYDYISDGGNNIPDNVVSISRNSKAIFIGSEFGGLYKYENGVFTSYFRNNQFNEKKIKLVKALGEDKLAVATQFGDVYIIKINKDKLHIIRKISSKSIDSVNINFVEEVDGKLIIGSFSNIVVVNGDKFYYIDKAQGVNYKTLSASAVNQGNILVGTDNGYYLINLESVANIQPTQPKISITGLQINNHKLDRDQFYWFDLKNKNLSLTHDQNNIFIDFTILNPKYSTKYKYRYRFNKEEWSEYFTDEVIRFNSLKAGSYAIELEITNLSDGNKSIIPLIDLKIYPPFYFNPFFLSGLSILIILLFLKYYRNKIRSINEINQLKIKNIQEIKDEENKRITLEKKFSEVRLMALQGQMNPHFIFNILNSIQYYIIDNDVNNALESLSQFAKLIRKMLELSSKNEITLKQEINFLELYVKIENFRYKNKIDFKIDINPDIDIYNIHIPPMLLQPLVENCFVHAFNPSVATNKINIYITKCSNFLEIIIEDNGKGMEQNKNKDKFYESKGLGIIRERLQLFNGSNDEFLKFETNSNGTKAILALKLFN
ncbi:sensor histidine kinase [Faecalibacter bovis]|uniref:Histidine kinase n=1 Tax=Faecalibacter bovis TaxID=2898187 RepID=A0ABX7XCF6_9FLAO|nr:histidine kinase [Faecalibacter bovis]QTV05601.1 histidine kinase [Faecalibacter bovis]